MTRTVRITKGPPLHIGKPRPPWGGKHGPHVLSWRVRKRIHAGGGKTK